MSRAWDAAVNADYVDVIRHIVAQWQSGQIDSDEAMQEVERETEALG